MSLSNSAESGVLKLMFQAVTWANIAQNAASAPLTNLYVSLHTADPGEAGSQTTSETTYGSYARQVVPRTTAGWAVAGTSPTTADNVAPITFPEASSGPSTCTYWGIGHALTGAGLLLASGIIDSPIGGLVVNSGVQPQFAVGALDITAS